MAWKFEPRELGLKGVYEIQLESRGDDRGFFMRVYDDKIFEQVGLHKKWVQENHSLSKVKGTLRGLHFQYAPYCESKIMRLVTGEAYMVIVDLRKMSKSFGKWVEVILSSDKKNLLFLPRGCATGIYTLTDNCNLLYKHDNYYSINHDEVIKWDDPDLDIHWPTKTPAIISERDIKGISFKEFIEKTNGGIII